MVIIRENIYLNTNGGQGRTPHALFEAQGWQGGGWGAGGRGQTLHALLKSAGVDVRWIEGPVGENNAPRSFEERGGGGWRSAGEEEGPTLF